MLGDLFNWIEIRTRCDLSDNLRQYNDGREYGKEVVLKIQTTSKLIVLFLFDVIILTK